MEQTEKDATLGQLGEGGVTTTEEHFFNSLTARLEKWGIKWLDGFEEAPLHMVLKILFILICLRYIKKYLWR